MTRAPPPKRLNFNSIPAVGEGQHAVSELLGESFGRPAADDRLEEFQELGGAAGPLAALLEEVADGLGHRVRLGKARRVEGLPHFFLGAAEGGAGGHGPGERVGASSRGRVHLGHAAEGGGDGIAERREDVGPRLVENRQEAVFGAGV